MHNKTNLQSLHETRWSSRANAPYSFISVLPVVDTAVEYLEEDEEAAIALNKCKQNIILPFYVFLDCVVLFMF